LAPDDRVALEVTGNAWEIARLIEPHVAQVLVVSPSDTGIRQARAKTDRLDARTLVRCWWRVARRGLDAATHGHISKQGSVRAWHAPVEACWTTMRQLARGPRATRAARDLSACGSAGRSTWA
jgi:hypothetical protein